MEQAKLSISIRSHLHHDIIYLLNKIYKKKHKLEYRISKLLICLEQCRDVFGHVFCEEIIQSITKLNLNVLELEERERIEKLFSNIEQKILDRKLLYYCSDVV